MSSSANLTQSWIGSLDAAALERLKSELGEKEAASLLYAWERWARPAQRAPEGVWDAWLIIAGRGWGKTRVGSETLRAEVESGRARHIALIAETSADGRDVMVEGESGILAISPPWFRPHYEPSKRRLTWPNGAKAFLYDAREPDQLRGPQHDFCWFDGAQNDRAGRRAEPEEVERLLEADAVRQHDGRRADLCCPRGLLDATR